MDPQPDDLIVGLGPTGRKSSWSKESHIPTDPGTRCLPQRPIKTHAPTDIRPPPHPGHYLSPGSPPIPSPSLPRPDYLTLDSQRLDLVEAPVAPITPSPLLPRPNSSTSKGKTGAYLRTGSDFPQSSSSSNTKAAPGTSTFTSTFTTQYGSSERPETSSPSPSPESSSSSWASRGSTHKPSAPQSLNKLKHRAQAPPSPNDTSEGFITTSNKASESFNAHDDAKSLQFPSRTIPDPRKGTAFSVEASSSESPPPEYEFDEEEFEPQAATFTSGRFSGPGRFSYPELLPLTSVQSNREPEVYIPPRKRRRYTATQSCDLRAGPSLSLWSTYLNSSTSSSVSQASTGPALHLHWQLLSYHVAQPDLFLHFDVAFPTHDIEYKRNSSYSVQWTSLYDVNLDKPAADKELTNMTINFERSPLQWDINVKRDEGIRVRDVFEAIYSAFDTPLTPHEKSLIPLRLRAGCEEAFRLRCNLAPELPIMQQRQGWKRVDALLHETLFRGLTQSKSGGGWTLNLSWTMLRTKQDRNIIDRERPMSDTHIPGLETTASYSPLPQSGSLVEYLLPYPNQNPNALPNHSGNVLFNLPLSAAFVPETGMDSDIMLPLRSTCRICNFARSSAILQHWTLCYLLNNIPPIPEPSSQDYTWAFFCRFVSLCTLFDSPARGSLPKIQPGSDRARLIDRLESDLENPKNTISWLHAPSGAGKSVIAHTLASHCRQKHRLAGSFFFSCGHANCRSSRSVVLSLAYQLGLSQPQAKDKIIAALDNDPGIISPSRNLREQFARLLIEPLEAADWRSPSRVFIIDAMDQCQDNASELISLFTRLLSHLADVGLHIFFTSRDHGEGVLIKRHILPKISEIALNPTDAAQDIRSFLRRSFDKIHRRHRLQCRKPWPPDEILDRLVDRAGLHFITGSLVVKFVDSPVHSPTDRMDLIYPLLLNPSSISELSVDNFYKSIIFTADDLDQAYRHLTIIANLASMLSCSQLDILLNRGPKQTFDMRSVLPQLSPLIHIPDGRDSAVQVCHESLCAFLSDPQRCGEHFISEAVIHHQLAYSSLSIMMEELPDDSAICSRISQLATGNSLMALNGFNNREFLCLAVFSPPEPLPFLSTLWYIMRHQYTGLMPDSRTKLALGYFCCTWQILQHLGLSTADKLPVSRFLANLQSLPVLLAFPIFLAFESSRIGETLSPSTLKHDPPVESLDAVAEIVNDVHALKNRCRLDSGALDYACTHWARHLSLTKWDDDLRSILTAFMSQKLQQWLVKTWCLQDFETCLRTLCEVWELCLTASPPLFDSETQHTHADVKAEEEEDEATKVARRSINEATEPVKLAGLADTGTAGKVYAPEAHLFGPRSLELLQEDCVMDIPASSFYTSSATFEPMVPPSPATHFEHDVTIGSSAGLYGQRSIPVVQVGQGTNRVSCTWPGCSIVLKRGSLSRHISEVHQKKIKAVCAKCGSTFTRTYAFNQHISQSICGQT